MENKTSSELSIRQLGLILYDAFAFIIIFASYLKAKARRINII